MRMTDPARSEYVVDLLDRLLGHDAWTTRQILDRCRELDDAQLHQQFDIGHETVYDTLVHMIGNVRTWTDLMNDVAIVQSNSEWEGLSVEDFITRHEAAYADFAALARRIRDEGRLNERWVDKLDDPPSEKTYGGAIAHVITHNMHHRSELLHMLARLGVPDLPEGDLLGWEAATRPLP
jgi:uncharacterized damage-inducible protein DinB